MSARLEQLFEPYRGNDAPGCIVGVAHRGELVYRAAFGMANVEHGVANTPATRMPLASITKHFTCAAKVAFVHEFARVAQFFLHLSLFVFVRAGRNQDRRESGGQESFQ